jgi:hypothetical protein
MRRKTDFKISCSCCNSLSEKQFRPTRWFPHQLPKKLFCFRDSSLMPWWKERR